MTKLSPEEVIKRAKAYFGQGGLGLDIVEENPCCVYLEGGGGHVYVTSSTGEKTNVELETREWDYHVQRFMQGIG
jgi:hypothetical protein